MISLNTILKTAGIILCTFILTPVIHKTITFGVSADIIGPPRLPLLFAIVAVQVVLMVIAYNLTKSIIPAQANWRKGLLFAVFFLLSTDIPSTLGLVAFEKQAWNFLSPLCIETYVTAFDDSLVYLIIGALIGVAFPASETRPLAKTARVGLAMVVCGIAFAVATCGFEVCAYLLTGFRDPHAPVSGTLWFLGMFFGLFVMTGAGLAALRVVTRQMPQTSRMRHWLGATTLFCMLWLPMQNFMVAFGWDFWGPLFFSFVSIIPIALTLRLADLLLVTPSALGD